jgi:hypothetical protein
MEDPINADRTRLGPAVAIFAIENTPQWFVLVGAQQVWFTQLADAQRFAKGVASRGMTIPMHTLVSMPVGGNETSGF